MNRLSLPHRLWRRLPARARRAALGFAAGRLAPKADMAPPAQSRGVVVAGELTQPTGVGEAARLYADACAALGLLRGQFAVRVGGRGDAAALPRDAALLLNVNAPSIPLMLARETPDLLRGRRVIGLWAWELPVVPAAWNVGRKYVHEVWACSSFAGAALEALMPGKVRVVPHPLGLRNLSPVSATRADFGVADHVVLTVVVFALGSSFARKNPLGAIDAFKRAFGGRDDQMLLVKFSGEAAFSAEAEKIYAAAGPNIKTVAGNWPPERVEALLACADIVLSLHRAEGFGLVPAQAMLRGVPVVATGWSGNMDYMDAHSAALVGYRLVPMRDDSGVYGKVPGAVWAEPDLEDAADKLRLLGDDAAWRKQLGARGCAKAAAALDGAALRAALAASGIT
jgi:glycosyltransferase involved in cell wall biosynthesis